MSNSVAPTLVYIKTVLFRGVYFLDRAKRGGSVLSQGTHLKHARNNQVETLQSSGRGATDAITNTSRLGETQPVTAVFEIL